MTRRRNAQLSPGFPGLIASNQGPQLAQRIRSSALNRHGRYSPVWSLRKRRGSPRWNDAWMPWKTRAI